MRTAVKAFVLSQVNREIREREEKERRRREAEILKKSKK